jgi:hypothetical protein
MKLLAARGKSATIRALLKHDGGTFSLAAPAPGRLVMSWYHAEGHGKQVLVAGVAVTFHKAGAARIKLVLTTSGRKLLRGAKSLKLSATASFRPVGHGTTRATRRLTLKR